MAKIDTSGWKEFQVEDLFETLSQSTKVKTGDFVDDGSTPVYSSEMQNNGKLGYVCKEPSYRITESTPVYLVFGDHTRAMHIVREDFCIMDNVKILKPKYDMGDNVLLFVTTSWGKAIPNHGYSRHWSIAKNVGIYLPATLSGEPDWTYMDEYMSAVMAESEASLENLRKADKNKHAIDTNEWKEFTIGELFKVVKGTRLTKAHMTSGEIRFIGSSALNNGCTAMIGNTENMHPANTITVCYNGSVGETFYQDQPFLASDDVNVLYPKFDMTKEMALFIVPLIKSVSARYNYVDKWKQEDMIADIIKLPVDTSGEPDWAYMDEYMQAVTESAKSDLSAMRSIG